MKRLLHYAVLVAWIVLGSLWSNAQIPAGLVTYTCNDDANVLWDVGKILQLKQLDVGIAELQADINMNVDFAQNGAGKLAGAGVTSIRVNSSVIAGEVAGAKYKVTGLITSKNGVTKVVFNAKATASTYVEGRKVSLSVTAMRTAFLDSRTWTLSGVYKNRASAAGVGSGTDTGPMPQTWADIQPYVGDGHWNLALNLANNGRNKITGTAALTLNSGAQYSFAVRGSYNGKTGLSKLTLVPDASARGSSLRLVMSGGRITSIQGKVSGQTIKLSPEPGPDSNNHAPVLTAIGNKAIEVGSALSFNATATDPDAGQSLTFSLAPGAPAGASITPAGAFSWTPTAVGTYSVTVVVSDNGVPAQSDSEVVTIAVNAVGQGNHPPVLATIGSRTVQVGGPLGFTATATDPDAGQTLSFSLAAGAPAGASITSAGVFSWTPGTAGSYSITVVVSDNGTPPLSDSETITVTVNPLSAGPVLTGPDSTTGSISLTWSFTWPGGLASSRNGYELEQSTASSTTGFSIIWNSVNSGDRASPRTYTFTRTAGTYWFRVRAALNVGYSAWSNVKQVTVTTPATLVRFSNTGSHPIVSLVVDGGEKYPASPLGLAPGNYYEIPVSAGSHSYTAVSGWWDIFGFRFSLYTYRNTISASAGQTTLVTFPDPTIQQLLTRFGNSASWEADYWDSNLLPHHAKFTFYNDGSFRFYVDNAQQGSGRYSLVRRNPSNSDLSTVTFSVPGYQGTYWEVPGYFTMWNGPGNSALQYNALY